MTTHELAAELLAGPVVRVMVLDDGRLVYAGAVIDDTFNGEKVAVVW